MTENELLSKTGDELSRALGEVLQPDDRSHVIAHWPNKCKKCLKEMFTQDGGVTPEYHELCEYTTDIPLDDWNVAMKWRDWAVEKFGVRTFGNTLTDVWIKTSHNEMGPDFVSLAQPEHYLIAAALCEIRSKGNA